MKTLIRVVRVLQEAEFILVSFTSLLLLFTIVVTLYANDSCNGNYDCPSHNENSGYIAARNCAYYSGDY